MPGAPHTSTFGVSEEAYGLTVIFQPVMGIYALAHPDTGRVMYVGKSADVDFRYRQHCDLFSSGLNLKKQEWIEELRREDKKPKLVVLEKVKSALKLDEAERKWIHKYKARGEAEINISSGGSNPAISSVLNAPREEWFQFAWKIRSARLLLSELASSAGRMASAKHCDAILKLERKLYKEIERIEQRVLKEFPNWHDVSKALLSRNDSNE